jgi:hypothetical protein
LTRPKTFEFDVGMALHCPPRYFRIKGAYRHRSKSTSEMKTIASHFTKSLSSAI